MKTKQEVFDIGVMSEPVKVTLVSTSSFLSRGILHYGCELSMPDECRHLPPDGDYILCNPDTHVVVSKAEWDERRIEYNVMFNALAAENNHFNHKLLDDMVMWEKHNAESEASDE